MWVEFCHGWLRLSLEGERFAITRCTYLTICSAGQIQSKLREVYIIGGRELFPLSELSVSLGHVWDTVPALVRL